MRACFFVAAFILFAGPALADEDRPNVVLIMTDDQGYADLSLHGNPHLNTPNIDALGRTGIRFERFFVNSFCAPTRAALLTGRYPLRCGVWGVTHNKEVMRADEVTIAEALRADGYRTACIGKWHNGEQFPFTPPGQGFDEFFGFHNGHINNYFDAQLLRRATPKPTRGYISDVLTDDAIRFVREIRGPQGGSSARPNDAGAARWQLYNMLSDPGEKKDLASRRPEVVARLSKLYEEWIDESSSGGLDRFPIPVGHDEENPVTLNAPQAYFDGSLRFYRGPGFAHDWLTGWTNAKSKVWFDIDVVRGGEYDVAVRYACPKSEAGSRIRVHAGNAAVATTVPASDAPLIPLHNRDQRSQQRYIDRQWGTLPVGRMSLRPGRQQLTIEVDELAAEQALELKAVVLTRVSDQPPPRDILAKDNLVAWCIVPFDAKQRGPTERAEMLARLGIQKVAYDWRENHVPTFEQEILEYKKHGLEYFAFWGRHERAFELFEKFGLHPQIWQTNPSPPGATQEEKVQAAVGLLLPLVERTRRMGCQLGLYNHGGWGGEPNNLVAVCQWLQQHHRAKHVGIIYNFHHGHDHIADFAESLMLMQPHLLCLNLDGMNDGAKPKILPIGEGRHEKRMLEIVLDSGYDGPVGILDHRDELDAEESLRANLRGLEKLRRELGVVRNPSASGGR